ncbi:ribosome assembly protein 4 (RSA4) [Candidatus Scalindua japonica]|uniref:Ribosome assembly protein 4 (RSA4) n=2 Tax=Candidatus Scalindua japonica TaxID=1284222 RepID=A0A286U101_9BACT|nr:ribosome assembly protein 4 (RSA4) [Candidatus Scalindua japonica]
MVRASCLSHDNKYLYTGSWDGTARKWDLKTGKCQVIYKGHKCRVYSIALTNDGTRLFSGDHGGAVKEWDTTSGECIETLSGFDYICHLDHNGKYLAIANGKEIRIHNREDNSTRDLKGHNEYILAIVIHPTENKLISCSEDNTAKSWDIESGKCIKTFTGHTTTVFNVVTNNDWSYAFTVSNDMTCRQWDLESRQCVNVFKGHKAGIIGLCYDTTTNHIITGSQDGTVMFWDVETGSNIATLHIYKDHALWTCPQEEGMDERWFYTENPEKLKIVEQDEEGNIVNTLDPDSSERKGHIQAYNRQDMVTARISNPDEYKWKQIHY